MAERNGRLFKELNQFLQKAVGFPVWQGTTVDIPPGGWGRFAGYGDESVAMCLAIVYGCARVRAETLGSLPWHIYREDKNGTRTKATDHPLYPILHDSPNAYQTSMEFRTCMELSFCLWGNAYALKRTLGGRIVGLEFLNPAWTRPNWDAQGNLVYKYSNRLGEQYTYTPEQIVHVKNFSEDGIIGMTPLRRHVIEHAYQAQNYGIASFRNMGRPSGILTSDQNPPASDETTKKMRANWDEAFAGTDNAGKTAVLWKGMKYQAVTIPPEDMQYIESRKLSAAEIAVPIYGVPLNKLGMADKTATYASAEQFDIEYVKYTTRPQCVRFEQAFNKALFFREPGTYCEMDLDSLLRGDTKTQAETFGLYVDKGINTRNEIRRKLNWPEISYADKLTVQSQYVDLDKLPDLSAQVQPAQASGDIRKSAEVPESGFKMLTLNLENKVGIGSRRYKGVRMPDGSMVVELEEVKADGA